MMNEQEAEEMIKTLLKRVNEKDQMISDLQAENVRLAKECSRMGGMYCNSLGVGDGTGQLFVHGDYESIKACQAIILERDRLKQLNLMTDEQVVMDLKVEIERLKMRLGEARVEFICFKQLITELAKWADENTPPELLQRAREATR
jgi:hypothetical protein